MRIASLFIFSTQKDKVFRIVKERNKLVQRHTSIATPVYDYVVHFVSNIFQNCIIVHTIVCCRIEDRTVRKSFPIQDARSVIVLVKMGYFYIVMSICSKKILEPKKSYAPQVIREELLGQIQHSFCGSVSTTL